MTNLRCGYANPNGAFFQIRLRQNIVSSPRSIGYDKCRVKKRGGRESLCPLCAPKKLSIPFSIFMSFAMRSLKTTSVVVMSFLTFCPLGCSNAVSPALHEVLERYNQVPAGDEAGRSRRTLQRIRCFLPSR